MLRYIIPDQSLRYTMLRYIYPRSVPEIHYVEIHKSQIHP